VLHEKGKKRLLLNYVKLAHVTTFLHRPSLLDLAPPTNQLLKITILLFGFSSCHLTGKKKFRQMADQRENHMFFREINFMHMQCSCATTRLHSTGSCQQQQR
jgi:hypothetical protein